MRASYPDREGYVERSGVKVRYEVYGDAPNTIMFIPGWSLPARSWKAQIPYFARHFRVIAYDPRGTGQSDRPVGSGPYALAEHVADALAILDDVGAGSATLVGKSRGGVTALAMAAEHPSRVDAVVAAAPMLPLSPWPPIELTWSAFEEPAPRKRQRAVARGLLANLGQLGRSRDFRLFARHVKPAEAAIRFSRQGMLDDFEGFARWFNTRIAATDPHSTKQVDDLVGWMVSTGPQAAADAHMADTVRDPAAARALCERVTCPVLVVHGEDDLTVPFEWGKRVAELTNGQLLALRGAGHLPGSRYPVLLNLAIREFVDSLDGAKA